MNQLVTTDWLDKNIEKVKGLYQWSSFAEKWHHFIEKI